MKTQLNKDYWQSRYENNETGWDAGKITTPLKEYIDQIEDKNLKILIPGAGNGYELDYFLSKGFKNVFVVDFAETPLQNIKKRIPELPDSQLIKSDFFKLDGTYDLILEQTFFCALAPELREKYVSKMHSLLSKNGKTVRIAVRFPVNRRRSALRWQQRRIPELVFRKISHQNIGNCLQFHTTQKRTRTVFYLSC